MLRQEKTARSGWRLRYLLQPPVRRDVAVGQEEQQHSPDEAKGNLGKPLIPGLRLLRSRDCGQGARALHSGYPSVSATKPSIRDIFETMKAARAKAKTTAFDDIVETLRRVP